VSGCLRLPNSGSGAVGWPWSPGIWIEVSHACVRPVGARAVGAAADLNDLAGLVGMTLRIYGPDEPWPTKKLPSHFRKQVEQAQTAGWSLHHHGADHWWGTLVCPAGENDPHVHTFKVDATARGSTFWAQEASKTVTKKCQHGAVVSGSKVKSRQAECERLLDGAERRFSVPGTHRQAENPAGQSYIDGIAADSKGVGSSQQVTYAGTRRRERDYVHQDCVAPQWHRSS
jgi:hypothetical protein